jgi:hypothetical protein
MALGVAEMLWLRALLVELKVDQRAQMKLWCDNKSTISIANNLVQHDMTKHIEIDRFLMRTRRRKVTNLSGEVEQWALGVRSRFN